MIVGTAGHIDHGKTSLVRALTGVDTDRLPEEKRRGITIELGYAYLPVSQGDEANGVLGFIDVPGHEKFVHTMLAGATGIDFGLIVVAADDGVMPQTREHIDILSLLDVPRGAVAISKCDRVDIQRIAQVQREVEALLAATSLVGSPVFAVSSATGAGIAALKAHLAAAHLVLAIGGRLSVSDGFRLAIDRVFTLEGLGTVVTGSVFSGVVRNGDRLALVPAQAGNSHHDIRVRSIHAQNRATGYGRVGQRCALNLAGIGREDIARGQWLTTPEVALETVRVDAVIRLLPGETAALRGGNVQVHLGTAYTLARIVLLDTDAVAAGGTALVQLVLARPLGAWRGDRLVLRDNSATRTIGGGIVLDPFAPARYRRTSERLVVLRTLAKPDRTARLEELVTSAPWGIDLARFAQAHSVPLEHLQTAFLSSAFEKIQSGAEAFGFSPARLNELEAILTSTLEAYHQRHPEEAGLDAVRLKRMAFPKLPDAAMHALTTRLLRDGKMVQNGVWLARPAHAERLNQQDKLVAERILPLITEGRFNPPWVRDLARSSGQPETLVRGVLARLARQGRVAAIVKDLYYDTDAVAELSAIAISVKETNHTIRAAAFRNATGLGRKRAIQILEFFDRVGFTRRQGDDHVVRNSALFAAVQA